MKFFKNKIFGSFFLVIVLIFGGIFALNLNPINAAASDGVCNIGDASITAPASAATVNGTVTATWTFNGIDCTTTDQRIMGLEASHDGGANWIPLASASASNSTSVTFNSVTLTPDDTNYEFRLFANSLEIATTTYSNVIIDNTGPTINSTVGASVNAGNDTITITFNETMDPTTLTNVTGITSITGSLSGAFTLANDAGAWSVSDTVYTITLDENTDGDFILNGETVTVVLATSVTDLIGNAYSGASSVSVAVTKESTVPTYTVAGTSVNDGNDTIALTFSENMSTTTITTALLQANTNITIDYSDNAGNTNAVDLSLANATIAWTGMTVATITLNEAIDGAYIPNGKYIGVTLLSVTDLVGNSEAGTEVYSAAITGELTAPTLIDDWSLNINTGVIVLNFSEYMATTTNVDETKITLQQNNDTSTAGEFYTLTNSVSTWTDSDTLTITLSTTDLNAIKLDTGLGISTATSFLEIAITSLITDLASNSVDLTNVTDGACIDATTFTADTTAPTLSNWTLNMNTGNLVLNFSEAVSTTTLAVAGITIQDALTSTTNYTLTDSTTSSSNGTAVIINLSTTDLNALKSNTSLATSTNSSYLVITTAVIDDMATNDVTAIADGSAMQVTAYTTDSTVPTVSSWTLNMNTGAMVINFSEAMDQTANVDETKITIQQSNDTSTAGEFYTLTDSTSAWTDSDTLTITLSATDINAIKNDTGLGISTATSYLEIVASSLLTDTVSLGLSLTNVTDGACIAASSFTADTTVPTVTAQTPLDNATDQAITVNPTITFSEAMLASSIDVNTVKLFKIDGTFIPSTVVLTSPTIATIYPNTSLGNNTQYYIWVSGVTDTSNNEIAPYTTSANQEFTTIALADGSLAIGPIVTTKPYAVADDSYANGWAWKFSMTVPTSETSFKMKFDEWMSGSNSIASANNLRYYTAQGTTAIDSANAISVSANSTYPSTAITLIGDLDSTTAGRQIEVIVEMKVPVGSSGGSYSTSYGVLTQ